MSERDRFMAQLQTARHALSSAADLAPGANLPAEHARAADKALALVDGAIAALAGHIFAEGGALRPSSAFDAPRELTGPRIEDRAPIDYVAVRKHLAREDLPAVVPGELMQVQAWLDSRGLVASGPPLIRYLVVDMSGELTVEIGVPVADPVAGDGRVNAGMVPAGRYAVMVHRGSYESLVDTNAALQRWAKLQGIRFDTAAAAGGVAWAGRVELYTIGPEIEIEPALWETEVAYLIAGGG